MKQITSLNGCGMVSSVDMGKYGKQKLTIADCVFAGEAFGGENTGIFIGAANISLSGDDTIEIEMLNNRYEGRVRGENGTNFIGSLKVLKDEEATGLVKVRHSGCQGVVDENIGKVSSNVGCRRK